MPTHAELMKPFGDDTPVVIRHRKTLIKELAQEIAILRPTSHRTLALESLLETQKHMSRAILGKEHDSTY